MDSLFEMMSGLGTSGTSWLLALLVASPIFIVMYAFARLSADRFAAQRRIGDEAAIKPSQIRLTAPKSEDLWSRMLERFDKLDTHNSSPENVSLLRSEMLRGGIRSAAAPVLYAISRIAMGALLPLAYLVLWSPEMTKKSDVVNVSFGAFVLCVLGLYLPKFWLIQRVARRERELLEGFPDALDLMVVTVQSGLGLDAAFNRVGRELSRVHLALSQEFALVSAELRSGQSRDTALRNFADRTGLEELRSFVALLLQSERLGTSIAQSLIIYSGEMRDKRIMKAEEKAHRLPVLLTIPLMLFILPCMVGAVLLPGFIIIIRKVIPALEGTIPS